MKVSFGKITAWSFVFNGLITLGPMACSSAFSAEAPPAALRAKQEAEAKGYIFASSHDEIVSRAKTEARLNIIVSLDQDSLKGLTDAFRKKYPFIDARAQAVRGTEVYLRLLQEMKAGLTKGQDVNDLAADYYQEYLSYQKKFDIFAMAEQKVLRIPPQMVDPMNRNVVAIGSGLQVVAYNKKLISAEKVPATWEDFLKPEFKDRKFLLDVRPLNVSALVPGWGLEKTLDFARKLAAQRPIWGSGHTALLATVVAGEHALHLGPNFDSTLRAKDKDKTDSLDYKILEPVPIRLNETQSVLNTAEHPYAALLWLEFATSPEGQSILDKIGPYDASVFIPGTIQEQAAHGKKLSVVDWKHFIKTPEYQKKIVEAYGFPRAESASGK